MPDRWSDARAVIRRGMVMGGVDVRRARRTLRGLPGYVRDARRFRSAMQHEPPSTSVPWGLPFPITADRASAAGDVTSHYFQQDLWAARRIHDERPAHHVDVGSRIDGFIAHLLVFREVEVIDIRPLPSSVKGLAFRQADATTLAGVADDSIESLSSLHAVEHFGLGRYGDPLDPSAWSTAMRSLARVLAPGGRLYFSVPVGRERVEFNAHRIFDPNTVIDTFIAAGLAPVAVHVIGDDGAFHDDADLDAFRTADEATALFELTKPTEPAPGGADLA